MFPGDEPTLTRRYIMMLTPDLRHAVTTKLWPLDGPERVGRKPRTWEEVGDVCEMELRDRADCFPGAGQGRHDQLYPMYDAGPLGLVPPPPAPYQPQGGASGGGGGSYKCKF